MNSNQCKKCGSTFEGRGFCPKCDPPELELTPPMFRRPRPVYTHPVFDPPKEDDGFEF